MSQTYLIIVGVDGSEAGRRALDWAVAHAALQTRVGIDTSVQAVTAWQVEPEDQPESVAIRQPDPRASVQFDLDQAIATACSDHPGVAIAGEVVEGDAARVLVKASASAQLLVVGSHGHTRLFNALVGSVAEACIRTSRCPVLIIPAADPAIRTRPTGALAPAAA
jgi:nucleotide-binding universal stress UspA family protein